jgi:penicillin-binding protein-related factor A (putative recombinase)
VKWIDAQDEFESFFKGKSSFVYQFEDTREAMGISRSKRVFTKARPSDYLVTSDGVTFFAEVKSNSDAVSFALSGIQIGQWNCCRRVVAAKGGYFFFIRNENDGQWYRIPAIFFVTLQDSNVKSVKWSLIEEFKWKKSTTA